ncbi:InlB B-repeat-containing protein [Butyrivibrio sp. XPD2006]|uniref:InlB B-repeat-containing protein n=1 Tax=Butyrivibrio sp. XPD2006 TaxID=1280668 RepID=UPI0003B74925|nr:InlB B-repeat-containing protein [Butyrivibrio sp. XPD2006]
MRKREIALRICSILLVICFALTSATAVQIIKVYAEDYQENDMDNPEPETDPEPEHGTGFVPDPEPEPEPEPEPIPEPEPEPEPQPQPAPEPDPFDYELACYTPTINFGKVNAGDVVYARQFAIVNIGTTTFPLTWEEVDPYTAFNVGSISPDDVMEPQESILFSVSPNEGLAPGTYQARYTFFSANDYRRHHTATVDVTITVVDSTPYITSVDVVPASATVPIGRSFDFDANVKGGNNYDPSVTWSLAGNQSTGTTVNADGTVTISPNETASSFTVVATSRQDPSKSDRGVVTVAVIDHVISIKADPVEGGAIAGGGAVRDGGSCTISASPNNNYVFKGWYEGGNLISSTGQTNISNVTSDHTFVAKFERQSCYVRTSVNNGDGGSVTGSQSVPYGGKMTITAKANDGYSFAGFVEDNKTISTASSIELNNIITDRNITAVFNRDRCTVNVSVYPQDTGKYEGAGTYNKGDKVVLRTKAYDGYEFTGWTINSQTVSRDDKYTIEHIKSDVNVVANFMKINTTTYRVTAGITNAGGTISPSGDFNIPEGSSVTYNIMAQAGYRITAVTVDGKNIGAVSSYTFNNIRGAHSITASFEKIPEAPKKSGTSGSTTKKNADNQPDVKGAQKKTEFNEKTAAEGAVTEQKVVDEKVPEQVETLDDEQYAEDVYTEAAEPVTSEDVPEAMTGSVMAKHNIDEATLRILIDDDAVLPMLREAFEDGTLQITVNNTYAADQQETAVQLYYSQPTLLNFEDVIAETLTPEEKYQVLTGTPVSFNIDITENTETVDAGTKELMQKKIGYKPVSYFDFLIMKTSNGTTSVINNTSAELEVVVHIPEQFKKEGRKFFVIRNHNGVVDILEDIGNDPNTVTFKTDRFSEYAIAYEAINVNRLVLRVVVIAFLSFILAVICFVNLVKYKRRAGRR